MKKLHSTALSPTDFLSLDYCVSLSRIVYFFLFSCSPFIAEKRVFPNHSWIPILYFDWLCDVSLYNLLSLSLSCSSRFYSKSDTRAIILCGTFSWAWHESNSSLVKRELDFDLLTWRCPVGGRNQVNQTWDAPDQTPKRILHHLSYAWAPAVPFVASPTLSLCVWSALSNQDH